MVKRKCPKCSSLMNSILTKKGVLIDQCSSCQGVWLERGEINFLVHDQKVLSQYSRQGLSRPQNINYTCPQCSSPMKQGEFPGFRYLVEECPLCKGLYFDANEFESIIKNKSFSGMRLDTVKPTPKRSPTVPLKIALPSLAFTTWSVCLTLYGVLLSVIVVFLRELTDFSFILGLGIVVAFALAKFYFAPILLDWQLRLIGSLDWVSLDELPAHFKKSLTELCRKHKIPLPRMGIIRDYSPQAYTYGRTPYSARVVFSAGMFQLLDKDELETVLAHELGHIKHWDFAIMTVLEVVPLLFYRLYEFGKEFLKGAKKKGGGGVAIAVFVSYIFYRLSEFLVLFISRVREYYADRFSSFATKKPNHLVRALIKISYGLLKESPVEVSPNHKDEMQGVQVLNIMSVSGSKGLAVTDQSRGNWVESAKDVMRWDLWNPWAFLYELYSTHPLIAKRINAINACASVLKQQPEVVFNRKKPESYWDEFLVDIFVIYLPLILGITGFISYVVYQGYTSDASLLNYRTWNTIFQRDAEFLFGLAGFVCLGFSIGHLIKTSKRYLGGGRFFKASIAAVLKVVKVSPVRSYPILLEGKVIGRGDAGQIFSEDFFLQDDTGLIFLNHEPFGFNFWFGYKHFGDFFDQKVTVKGWYRRAPIPYIEVKKIESPYRSSRSFTNNYQWIKGWIGVTMGLIFLYMHTQF